MQIKFDDKIFNVTISKPFKISVLLDNEEDIKLFKEWKEAKDLNFTSYYEDGILKNCTVSKIDEYTAEIIFDSKEII